MAPLPPGSNQDVLLLAALGQAVRRRRLEAGLTSQQLAQRAGLSPRFIGLIEGGQGNPAYTRLLALAGALGCGVAQLVEDAQGAGGPGSVKPLVALLGLRGAGKTSVGTVLARLLGTPFVEVDARVEAQAGLTLGEIFALHGEDYYRRLEETVLETLVQERRPAVLATGGGVVTHPRAMELLRQAAFLVWLRAPVQAHWERVVAQGDQRPMAGRAQARAELDALYAQRSPLYAHAHLVVDTHGLGVEQVARHILGHLPQPAR